MMRTMKERKNLSLDAAAVAHGQRAAKERNLSLSALVEKQLFAIPTTEATEDYWPGPAGEMLDRPGDARADYLKQKHA